MPPNTARPTSASTAEPLAQPGELVLIAADGGFAAYQLTGDVAALTAIDPTAPPQPLIAAMEHDMARRGCRAWSVLVGAEQHALRSIVEAAGAVRPAAHLYVKMLA
jgi:hypothetical protein